MARSLEAPGPRPAPQVQDLKKLGQLVRNRRLELELRIDDAAHVCGVASNLFSRLENGGTIGVDRLLLVLSGLGLSMLVVIKEEARSVPGAPVVSSRHTRVSTDGNEEV
jgi:transcriptional regulator with XRE-family HTH domain